MKKVIKMRSDLFKKDITVVVEDSLTALQGKNMAPNKQKIVDAHLSKIKNLPERRRGKKNS